MQFATVSYCYKPIEYRGEKKKLYLNVITFTKRTYLTNDNWTRRRFGSLLSVETGTPGVSAFS